MTNRFLMSVAAAALIAGTGFANAQGPGGASREGSSAQQSAPSSGGAQSAPQHRESTQPGMKSSQSEKAQDMKGGKDMKAEGREGKEKSTVGQAPEKGSAATKGHEEKSGSSMSREDNKMGQKGEKGSTDTNRAQQKEGTTDTNRAQTSPQGGAQTSTTGNAATSARVAAPPAEKRTQIVSAIRSERIEEATNVNVNVAIGTRLPDTVRFYPLPPRIVEIYPEWRGFEVVLIHGRYVIVRPQTREIVYIIEG